MLFKHNKPVETLDLDGNQPSENNPLLSEQFDNPQLALWSPNFKNLIVLCYPDLITIFFSETGQREQLKRPSLFHHFISDEILWLSETTCILTTGYNTFYCNIANCTLQQIEDPDFGLEIVVIDEHTIIRKQSGCKLAILDIPTGKTTELRKLENTLRVMCISYDKKVLFTLEDTTFVQRSFPSLSILGTLDLGNPAYSFVLVDQNSILYVSYR